MVIELAVSGILWWVVGVVLFGMILTLFGGALMALFK